MTKALHRAGAKPHGLHFRVKHTVSRKVFRRRVTTASSLLLVMALLIPVWLSAGSARPASADTAAATDTTDTTTPSTDPTDPTTSTTAAPDTTTTTTPDATTSTTAASDTTTTIAPPADASTGTPDASGATSAAAGVGSTAGTASGATTATTDTNNANNTAKTSGSTTTTTTRPPAKTTAATQLAIPPKGQAYLGAFVDPSPVNRLTSTDPTGALPWAALQGFVGPSSVADEIRQLPAFQQGLPRPLSLVPVYQDWDDTVTTTQLDAIVAAGGIPLISWSCTTTNKQGSVSTKKIAQGKFDPAITTFAKTLKSLGAPVLLNVLPDPNGSGSGCLIPGKLEAQGNSYQDAFDQIRSDFTAAGATNVGFVWSIDPTVGTPADWDFFYPGSNVDWIGADADVTSASQGPDFLGSIFRSWYSYADQKRKPLLISRTGAPGISGLQDAYLQQVKSELPTELPDVKGVVYFDAAYHVTKNKTDEDSLSTKGLADFAALSNTPAFQPPRAAAPTVTVSGPSTGMPVGQVVHIQATVSGNDRGGYLTFLDEGAPVSGCEAVAVRLAGSCDTSSLSLGQHEIAVDYSGDAQTNPAETSSPLQLSIIPLSGLLACGTFLVDDIPTRQLCPPAIPSNGQAYLGAFVKPNPLNSYPDGTTPTEAELQSLATFNAHLSRPLSIVHVFQLWNTPVPNSQLQQILAAGGTPLIDWKCDAAPVASGSLPSDAEVIAGEDDQLITNYAKQLAKLEAPVFLRWYYEPNFPGSKPFTNCLGSANTPNQGPAGYVRAWQHIHKLFMDAHATNVSFVWCMGVAGRNQDFSAYYPGSADVDWIAADGYERKDIDPNFAGRFGSWYADFSSFGKPMMVSETAAIGPRQNQYLNQIEPALSTDFPQIKAIVYLDTPTRWSFALTDGGKAAFQKLANSTNGTISFRPTQQPTVVTLPLLSPPPKSGQEVQLTASISTNDAGGSLSFYTDGSDTPLRGCADIPVNVGMSCNTDALPASPAGGVTAVTAKYSGDADFGPSSGSLQTVVGTVPKITPNRAPGVPDPGSAYLGAWVNPVTSTSAVAAELKALPGVNAGLGRPLSIVHIYQGWSQFTPNYVLRDVLAGGGIPMIDWSCGDSDANVSGGVDDAAITGFAHQLAALHAPVFLRWYYEPNFTSSASDTTCLNPLGVPGLATAPLHYRQAFQHIHDLFQAAGAGNVAFVWAPTVSGGDEQDLTSYFPGSAYVDWIAADGYAATDNPGPNAAAAIFDAWYQQFSVYGKPMMISETGAYQCTATDGSCSATDQAGYLTDLGQALGALPYQSTVKDPVTFPLVRALVYFDAPGRSQVHPHTYALNAGGMAEFQSLSKNPFFLPHRFSTTTGVTATQLPAAVGQRVQLTAAVPADNGGAINFFDNGAPIPDCQGVSLVDGPTCVSKSVPVGTSAIEAVYTGDANFDASTSAPTAATVIAPGASSVGGGSGGMGRGSLSGGSFGAFAGVPTLGGVQGMGFAGPGAHSAAGEPGAGGAGYPTGEISTLLPAAAGGGGSTYQTAIVLIGVGLVAGFGGYILATWVVDRRRRIAGLPGPGPAGGAV